MRRDTHRRSRGLFGFVERHRVATTFVALFLVSSPARPDDRQLLQANAGAPANVLIILDSSYSMNNEFSDTYRLPAFLDDFIYPEGTTTAVGSKFAVAKRVLRKVMTSAAGVNWAFSTYRNPDPTFGAADTSAVANAGDPAARLCDRRRQDGRPGPGERRRRVAVLRRPARGRQRRSAPSSRRVSGPTSSRAASCRWATRSCGSTASWASPIRDRSRPGFRRSTPTRASRIPARRSSRAAGAAPSVRTDWTRAWSSTEARSVPAASCGCGS